MKSKKIKIKRLQSLVAVFIVLLMLFVPLSVLADEPEPEPEPQFEAEVDVNQDSVVPVDLDDVPEDLSDPAALDTLEPIVIDEDMEGEQVGFKDAEFDFEFHATEGEIGGVYIDPLFD